VLDLNASKQTAHLKSTSLIKNYLKLLSKEKTTQHLEQQIKVTKTQQYLVFFTTSCIDTCSDQP